MLFGRQVHVQMWRHWGLNRLKILVVWRLRVTPCSLVGDNQLLWRWRQEVPQKRRYTSTRSHGVTVQKNPISNSCIFFCTVGLPTSSCQVIVSGFRRSWNEIFVLLGFYAATFRDNLPVPSSTWGLLDCLTLEDLTIACPETSALHKVPEEGKSQPTLLFMNLTKDMCRKLKIIK